MKNMFSPESHLDSKFGASFQMPQGPKMAEPQNPFHGIRRSARKAMGFPKIGLAEQGALSDFSSPRPGAQAGTLVNSFGGQNKAFGRAKF